MVPFILQTPIVVRAKPAPELNGGFLTMRTLDMLVQHGFEMEHFVTKLTLNRMILVMVFHMLSYHFLGIEFTLAHIALEEGSAMYLFVFRKIAGVAKAFIAKCTFVECKFRVFP